MEKVFEPVIENQKQKQTEQQRLSVKQIQVLHDSAQTTTQPIEKQTKAIPQFSTASNENFQSQSRKEYYNIMKFLLAKFHFLAIWLVLTN